MLAIAVFALHFAITCCSPTATPLPCTNATVGVPSNNGNWFVLNSCDAPRMILHINISNVAIDVHNCRILALTAIAFAVSNNVSITVRNTAFAGTNKANAFEIGFDRGVNSTIEGMALLFENVTTLVGNQTPARYPSSGPTPSRAIVNATKVGTFFAVNSASANLYLKNFRFVVRNCSLVTSKNLMYLYGVSFDNATISFEQSYLAQYVDEPSNYIVIRKIGAPSINVNFTLVSSDVRLIAYNVNGSSDLFMMDFQVVDWSTLTHANFSFTSNSIKIWNDDGNFTGSTNAKMFEWQEDGRLYNSSLSIAHNDFNITGGGQAIVLCVFHLITYDSVFVLERNRGFVGTTNYCFDEERRHSKIFFGQNNVFIRSTINVTDNVFDMASRPTGMRVASVGNSILSLFGTVNTSINVLHNSLSSVIADGVFEVGNRSMVGTFLIDVFYNEMEIVGGQWLVLGNKLTFDFNVTFCAISTGMVGLGTNFSSVDLRVKGNTVSMTRLIAEGKGISFVAISCFTAYANPATVKPVVRSCRVTISGNSVGSAGISTATNFLATFATVAFAYAVRQSYFLLSSNHFEDHSAMFFCSQMNQSKNDATSVCHVEDTALVAENTYLGRSAISGSYLVQGIDVKVTVMTVTFVEILSVMQFEGSSSLVASNVTVVGAEGKLLFGQTLLTYCASVHPFQRVYLNMPLANNSGEVRISLRHVVLLGFSHLFGSVNSGEIPIGEKCVMSLCDCRLAASSSEFDGSLITLSNVTDVPLTAAARRSLATKVDIPRECPPMDGVAPSYTATQQITQCSPSARRVDGSWTTYDVCRNPVLFIIEFDQWLKDVNNSRVGASKGVVLSATPLNRTLALSFSLSRAAVLSCNDGIDIFLTIPGSLFQCNGDNVIVRLTLGSRMISLSPSVRSTSAIAATAASFLSVSGFSLARVGTVMDLASCDVDSNDPLSPYDSPLGLSIKEGDGMYLRGAVVGNMVLLSGVCLIIYCIAILRVFIEYRGQKIVGTGKSTTERFVELTEMLHMPGLSVVFLSVWMQPTLQASFTLLIYSPMPNDGDSHGRLVNVAIGVLGVVGLSLPFALFAFRLVWNFQCYPIRRSFRPLKQTSDAFRVLSSLVHEDVVWCGSSDFVRSYGEVFDCMTSIHWFPLIDMSMAFVYALLGALQPPDAGDCRALLYVLLGFNVCITGAVLFLRPYRTMLNRLFVSVSQVMVTSSTVCALLGAEEVAVSICTAQLYMSILVTALDWSMKFRERLNEVSRAVIGTEIFPTSSLAVLEKQEGFVSLGKPAPDDIPDDACDILSLSSGGTSQFHRRRRQLTRSRGDGAKHSRPTPSELPLNLLLKCEIEGMSNECDDAFNEFFATPSLRTAVKLVCARQRQKKLRFV